MSGYTCANLIVELCKDLTSVPTFNLFTIHSFIYCLKIPHYSLLIITLKKMFDSEQNELSVLRNKYIRNKIAQ